MGNYVGQKKEGLLTPAREAGGGLSSGNFSIDRVEEGDEFRQEGDMSVLDGPHDDLPDLWKIPGEGVQPMIPGWDWAGDGRAGHRRRWVTGPALGNRRARGRGSRTAFIRRDAQGRRLRRKE